MPLDTDILSQLISRKRELLVQLRDAGHRQMQLIEGGDMGELLKVLSSKQRVLEYLQGVERQLDPFRGQRPDQRTWRSAADREACSRMSAECESLLAEVIAGEKRGEEKLVTRRDRAAAQLQLAQHAWQARAAYDQPSSRQGQLDLLSGT